MFSYGFIDRLESVSADYANLTLGWIQESTFRVVFKVFFVVLQSNKCRFLSNLLDSIVQVQLLRYFVCLAIDSLLSLRVCYLIATSDIIMQKLVVLIRWKFV